LHLHLQAPSSTGATEATYSVGVTIAEPARKPALIEQVTPVLRSFVNDVFGAKALPAPILTALPNNRKVAFASELLRQRTEHALAFTLHDELHATKRAVSWLVILC
jgi:hypothetical protein